MGLMEVSGVGCNLFWMEREKKSSNVLLWAACLCLYSLRLIHHSLNLPVTGCQGDIIFLMEWMMLTLHRGMTKREGVRRLWKLVD